MDTNVLIAIISAATSIVIASLSYFFSKKREVEGEWRKQKLTQYRELLSSLSDCAIDGINNDEAQRRFSQAFNTIALVAPQTVIRVLLAFHDEIAFSNPNPSKERHDQLLKELVLAIRQDMKLSPADDAENFQFRLIGRAPKKKSS
jgi:hypothetical protein